MRKAQLSDNEITDRILNESIGFDLSNSVSMSDARTLAEKHSLKTGGFIPTMPELMKALIIADQSHPLRQYSLITDSEATVGYDSKRVDYFLLVIHGRGILTQELMSKSERAFFFEHERTVFENALDGILSGYNNKNTESNDKDLQVYSTCELRDIKSISQRHFGVYMPLKAAIDRYYPMKKEEFTQTSLMMAYAGAADNLGEYFDTMTRLCGKETIKPQGFFYDEERFWVNPYSYALGLDGRTGAPIIMGPETCIGRYIAV